MNLEYDFFEVNELGNTQGKYRARAVKKEKITTEMLVDWMSKCHGISPAQAKGFIGILADTIVDFVTSGHDVEVGDLGHFSASISSRLVDNPTEIRAESVRFSKLNYRASMHIKKRIRLAEIKKVDNPRYKMKSKPSTREDRAQRLKNYFAKKRIITRADYGSLIGIGRKAVAVGDLNAFVEEGWLERHGAGKTVVYMLVRNDIG